MHQAIARRYRPQLFRDVIGQEATVTTLQNALKRNQVAHAYLFSGPRGVGKTTLARLFAKVLNCAAGGLEPCNTCPSCLEITAGQSLDVLEIDGASNRGIDDIRQLTETVGFAPSHGRYKITLLDEVHMLTKEAFNALLKTLEEPPAHAKFFFATTEPHKVLPTILSRCQRFELARVPPEQIERKLLAISSELTRPLDAEAAHLIAAHADGSLRDAESLLDQLLCFADGPITAPLVRQALGLAPLDAFFALDQAIAASHLPFAFTVVEQLYNSGRDLFHFYEELVSHIRLLTAIKLDPNTRLPPDLSSRYAASAATYTAPQLLYLLETLLTSEADLRRSLFPRVSLESLLLRLLRSRHRLPLEVLTRRLLELESTLKTAEAPKNPEAPEPPKALPIPETPKPVELKDVPFNPVTPPPEPVLNKAKHDTLMRFAAVELEGTLKS